MPVSFEYPIKAPKALGKKKNRLIKMQRNKKKQQTLKLLYLPSFFSRSEVENTLTMPCFLCLFSSDHNSELLNNAKAKYATSLVCNGNISLASEMNLAYFDFGITSIFLNNNLITNSSSALVNPEYFNNFSSRFLISSNTNSGEYRFTPSLTNCFINLNINPLLTNAWNIMFASTTSIILNQRPCFLATPNFTSLANLKACPFVSLLFDTILSAKENSTSSTNSFTTLFKASLNSSFNSGEISTLTTTSDILQSPIYNNQYTYLNVMEN